MSHQCVKCNKLYGDGSKELLQGCECGGKFFFYIRNKKLSSEKEEIIKLSSKEREKIQQDVLDIVGSKIDEPVILDLESIKVVKPGKFEIDVNNLMKGKTVVFRMEKGKYMIDIATAFKKN